jgi:hypothetical protein
LRPLIWLLICGPVVSLLSCGNDDSGNEAALRAAFEARCEWIVACEGGTKEACMDARTQVFTASDACQEAYIEFGECLAGPGDGDCEAHLGDSTPCNDAHNGLVACDGPDGDEEWVW